MTIYEIRLSNTRNQLASRKMPLKDLAAKMGKAAAQVSSFAGRNPHKNIGNQIAREIEIALDLPKGFLDQPTPNNSTMLGPLERRLPVVGSIAAGAWCEAVDNFQPGDAEEWIEAPGPVGPHAFILRIEGISMENKFFEGDKVVIDPSLEALPGHFVAAKRTSDQAVTFKQLKQEGTELYLYALNPAWPDRVMRITEEWHICGRARWKIVDL